MKTNRLLLAAGTVLAGLCGCAGTDTGSFAVARPGCAMRVETRASGTTCVLDAVTPAPAGADLMAQMDRERRRIEGGQPSGGTFDVPLFPPAPPVTRRR